jgi:hypothetical protein
MYVIVWDFVARSDKVADFVAAYRPDGDWARLFSLASGYLGTELLVAADREGRFLTIDRWASADDYLRFQERFADKYKVLDTRLEGFTVRENKVGAFVVAES